MAVALHEHYKTKVIPALMEKFGYKNVNQVPRLEKIVVNIGVGVATQDIKLLESTMEEMGVITGQKPVIRRARISVSNFKLRKGMPIGCKVTLRRKRMYEFFERLLSFAIPRIRDFRGISDRSFDGRGNYNLGIKEQIIFPEIDFDTIDRIHGLNISIVTTAKTDEEASVFLMEMGMPFRLRPA